MTQPLEVLVLDDEPIVGSRIKPSLEKAGYRVEIMTDSQKAMERIKQKQFDIVVTDFKMSRVSGLDLLRAQKELWPETEVIIITGYATLETAREAMQSGVYDFMAKPFRLHELKEVIGRAAESIRNRRQREAPAGRNTPC
jgi:DNA-binding NtrC family response regulator